MRIFLLSTTNYHPQKVMIMTTLTPYDELEIESNRIGWPVRFKTDMTKHDRTRLQSNDAPKIFGWILRKLGTLLLDPRMSRRNLESYAYYLTSDADGNYFYWYDGHSLKEVSCNQLFELLRKNNNPSNVDIHSVY